MVFPEKPIIFIVEKNNAEFKLHITKIFLEHFAALRKKNAFSSRAIGFIMNKLWIKLTIAFFAVTLTGLIAVAVLVNNQVSTQFRNFVMRNDMLNSPLVASLETFYATHGNWSGIETVFETSSPGMGMGHGMGGRMGNLTLTDTTGTVIFSRRNDIPPKLSATELSDAVPLEVGGKTVGYLHFLPPGQSDLTAAEQAFLQKVNLSILQAGLIAAILGLVFGIVVARGLSAPLQSLSAAARRIARGELGQRVPESGSQEIADLAHSFNEMAAALAEAERLRQNLVADVAHELRTPLTVLQGNLRAILDGVYQLDKAEIIRLYDQTRHLIRLVNDLRDLTQAEAGQLTLNCVPVDLNTLANDTISLFEPVAAAENITLRTDLPADLPPVSADSARLSQVLHNLLANAIRHTPAEGSVTLRGGSDAASVWLAVSDTGEGIASEDLPHVFDRFYRADRARARSTGGSGLGLAIARAIIAAHGGEISAASDGIAGHGSTFTIRLPREK